MNKVHATITIDADILALHRNAGNNVSRLCNDFLCSYFPKQGEALIQDAENKTNAIKQAISERNRNSNWDSNTIKILEEAKQKRTKGEEFRGLITLACLHSNKTREEMVNLMDNL